MTCKVHCNNCKTVLYVLREPPTFGSVMDASEIVWPEGVRNGDRIVCSNCGYLPVGELMPERWALA